MTSMLSRALMLIVACALSLSSPATAQSRPPIISALDVQVTSAPVTVAVAGRQHLVYELHVTNLRRSEVTLTRVQVLDATNHVVLGDFSDAALSDRLARPGAPADVADKRAVPPGTRAIVYLWLRLDERAPVPSRIQHRIAFDVTAGSPPTSLVISTPAVDVDTRRPLVLSPPLEGGPWAALYDPLLIGGHRTAIYAVEGRARIPARFAIDFVRLEQDGTHANGDRSQIANWHGYGAEVLAVADATVIEAMDDIAEAPSIAAAQGQVPLQNISGNFVTLDLGGGRYAFYEHLKHGSLRVKPGDRVEAGDVLGLLGNSGSSSSGPHLHFHVADARAELAAEGLPYVFSAFETLGAFDTIGGFTAGERWKPMRDAGGGARTNELPAANSVVVFPGGITAASGRHPDV